MSPSGKGTVTTMTTNDELMAVVIVCLPLERVGAYGSNKVVVIVDSGISSSDSTSSFE